MTTDPESTPRDGSALIHALLTALQAYRGQAMRAAIRSLATKPDE